MGTLSQLDDIVIVFIMLSEADDLGMIHVSSSHKAEVVEKVMHLRSAPPALPCNLKQNEVLAVASLEAHQLSDAVLLPQFLRREMRRKAGKGPPGSASLL